MPRAKVTSKGQITLPKQIRIALNIEDGQRVSIDLTGEGAALIRPMRGDVLQVAQRLKRQPLKPMTLREMSDLVETSVANEVVRGIKR